MILKKYKSDHINSFVQNPPISSSGQNPKCFPTRNQVNLSPVPLPFIFWSSCMELAFPGTPFLPQGLFTCFFHLGHTFTREPHGLLPHFAQISPSQSSNVTFSMRLSLTPLFKITCKFSPYLLSSALFFFLALITSKIYMLYIVLIYFVYYLSLSIRL